MDILNRLRELNPDLELLSVYEPEFERYGRVLGTAVGRDFSERLEDQPIPEEGNCYVASVPELEQTDFIRSVRHGVFGDMDIQAGYCNGRGHRLNALEYHKCSEVNYTTTGLVLLLALPEQLCDGKLNSAAVKGFYLPPFVPVEIFPLTLHFAPCRTGIDGFNCLVVLERGVNSPAERVDTSAAGEEKLLWMRGKWMVCHPDSPQAQRGAYVGISGENIELKTVFDAL